MLSFKKIAKNCVIIFAVTICTLLAVDLIAYLVTPSQGISLIPAYKKDRFKEKLNEVVHYFPRGYKVADPAMGFDIAKNFPSISANLADSPFQIFSNDLGCFDHHSLAEIKNAKSYDYFAGDSFAWGMATMNKIFPQPMKS